MPKLRNGALPVMPGSTLSTAWSSLAIGYLRHKPQRVPGMKCVNCINAL
jgi:hypothetical protein